ncbi:carbon-nitrogen hydrolase family protein [uncultured Williamsia sp.]|uniref:carbon-nitrogen hydrolase family protein n=1 Tax=uncultured Williamsia sp. TaxID=259311 RepID=UPI00261C4954|nr:carbon-nitrogen hydrolase family protein [uncultured Williamsia sp.]
MTTTIRIGLAQVCSSADAVKNLAIIDDHATRAAESGAAMVVFPEAMMRCFGGPLADVAEPIDGPWADAVRAIAARVGITVVAGMFTPADAGRVRNTLLVTGGGVEAHYDKIHLFDAFGFLESDTVAPGSDPLVVDVAGVRVGFATCYDIRFPALFHRLADLGASVIVVAASWGAGAGKVDQWTLLARARALDSTSHVMACDQALPADVLDSPAPRGVGHSMVVSPTGTVTDQLGDGPGLLVVDLDSDLVDSVRATLPVLRNRRPL